MEIKKIAVESENLIPPIMKVELIGNVDLFYNNNSFEYKIVKHNVKREFVFPTSKPKNILEFDNNRYGFIITENGEYVGHAVVEHKFNNTLYIEDFDIATKFRGKKYAKSLMDFLESHAKECKLSGLSLEVQSNNVIAFLFYMKAGYKIGGFDTLFYEKTRQKGETAIYLYKLF